MLKKVNSEEQITNPIQFLEEGVCANKIDIDNATFAYHIASVSERVVKFELDKDYILFAFSVEKEVSFHWNTKDTIENLSASNLLMFSYPYENTALDVQLEKNTELYFIALSIGKLHTFFGSSFGVDKEAMGMFMSSFKMKKYFSTKPVGAEVSIIFHQMFNNAFEGSHKKLYLQGKVLEVVSYYMQTSKPKSELEEQCPFVNDHLEMEKIKIAREIIVKEYLQPPSIKELAKQVGTNEFKLKVGFKNMYGNTVYGYIADYRMQKARMLLEHKELNVKEIAHQIGYSNPSYFISAYKKKFGITPKKHLLGLS